MITQEQLQNLVPKSSISGIILVKNYKIQLTKNNKEYIAGDLQSGATIPFKAWGSSVAFTKLKNEAYENVPSMITATVDDFGGSNSLIVESIQAIDGYTPDQFLPIKYNTDAYWDALKAQVAKRVSPKGLEIVNSILFNNEELAERFKVEFAANHHHDSCKSGLLAHTYKVLNNITNIIAQYPAITHRDTDEATQDYKDLLYISALLHDIGKTVEMNFGVYQPESIVTHRYLGIEFITPYKSNIVEAYDENWYYQLISVMLQHHGQWGDPCKTVAAYIVNKADELDAYLTDLADKITDMGSQSGSNIKIDGGYLTL